MNIENVKNAIKESKSKADVLRVLNLSINGRNHKSLNNVIDKYNLDISHFNRGVDKKRKYDIVKKECPICGEIFETKKGHNKEKMTCSHACSNVYFRSGENNGNYKDFDDIDDVRSANFSKKYRKVCFEHHEHKCVYCGEDKILDVHHYDGNKRNNKPENLIPICPTHHGYYHSRYRNIVEDKINEYYINFKNNRS